MSEEKALLELKENVNSHMMKILDEQDIPVAEKNGIKEFFSYMSSLNSDDLSKIKKDSRFVQASIEFKKDRSQPETIINACNEIIKDAG